MNYWSPACLSLSSRCLHWARMASALAAVSCFEIVMVPQGVPFRNLGPPRDCSSARRAAALCGTRGSGLRCRAAQLQRAGAGARSSEECKTRSSNDISITTRRRRALAAVRSGRSTPPASSETPPPRRGASGPPDYGWRQRLPADSGWDLLKLQKRDAATFNRFREVEVIHARWAMLGVLSLLLGEAAGSSPFPPRQLSLGALAPWGGIVLLLLALLESYRLAALWGVEDAEQRIYPGKRFDILGLARKSMPRTSDAGADNQQDEEPPPPPRLAVFASWLGGLPGWLAGGWWWERREMTEEELLTMKSKELRNGRLAMVSFIGCCIASALTGKGPITLLVEHLADPVHHTVLQNLAQ